MAEEIRIIQKFGEVTNQKLFQVKGHPHWYSHPQKALDAYNKLKQFVQNGGFKGRK